MKPAATSDREQFPSVEDHIGENPARFLDCPLFSGSPGSSPFLTKARIDGIDRFPVVNAWIAIERKLERGPRDRVIELLEDRKRELQQNGERPDLEDQNIDELREEVEPTESVAVWPDRDGGERSVLKVREQAVATDGGEQQ